MNHEKHESDEKILFKEESLAIQGAIFEVYREMGTRFLEAVYQVTAKAVIPSACEGSKKDFSLRSK